ncbi:MAG: ABC transporter permease [Clostridiales bacterium]|jgi:ABC-2 type transport system permease protein|nr:ABC transporter permease [Clostridiales bacterium]
MYKFKQIFRLDLMNLLTNPMWVFYAIGFPLALILVLGFLMSGSYGHTVTSYDYYGVALMIFGIFNAATFSANSIMEERIKSPNMRIVYSPVRPFYIHFSKVLASFVFCTAAYSLVAVLLHITVGINYGGADWWAALAIMLAGNFFFASLGVTVCCLLKNEGITNNILSTLFALFAILGGLFFPIDGLGKAVSAISWLSPAKWMLAACFRIIYDGDFTLLAPLIGGLALLSALSVLLGARFFRGEDYI